MCYIVTSLLYCSSLTSFSLYVLYCSSLTSLPITPPPKTLRFLNFEHLRADKAIFEGEALAFAQSELVDKRNELNARQNRLRQKTISDIYTSWRKIELERIEREKNAKKLKVKEKRELEERAQVGIKSPVKREIWELGYGS